MPRKNRGEECLFSLVAHKENRRKEMRFAAVQIPAKIATLSLNGENLQRFTMFRAASDSSPFFTLVHTDSFTPPFARRPAHRFCLVLFARFSDHSTIFHLFIPSLYPHIIASSHFGTASVYANSYCKIAIFNAFSSLQMVSNERFSSPFKRRDTYCGEHPMRVATSCRVSP